MFKVFYTFQHSKKSYTFIKKKSIILIKYFHTKRLRKSFSVNCNNFKYQRLRAMFS